MTDLNSTEYHVARERRERDLAAQAHDPAIAAIHREMAERYAQIASPMRMVRAAAENEGALAG